MTIDEAVAELESMSREDIESAHYNGDEILLKVMRSNGLDAVADAYEKMRDDCDGFWYS